MASFAPPSPVQDNSTANSGQVAGREIGHAAAHITSINTNTAHTSDALAFAALTSNKGALEESKRWCLRSLP